MQILLIEDELIWRMLLQQSLEDLGYKVCHVSSNIENAISYLETHIPDLILSDIMLNKNTIFDMLQNGKYKEIPFLFVTSSIDENYYKASQLVDTSNYLIKPFHPISLDAAIKALMKNYSRILPELPQGIKIKGRNNQTIWLKNEEIVYIKAEGNYCIFKTKNEQYALKKSLTNICKILGNTFILLHRAYAVNKKFIEKIDLSKMVAKTITGEIPISRTFKNNAVIYINEIREAI